ncbi:hypothetical protein MEO93_28085 [Dolichospermum sp. ST_sed3]|nr:hypothetical protein [Dolichospermum sp. ST_sed3]
MSEIDILLNELRGMKASERAALLKNKETWSKISQKDWQGLGLNSEEELKAWIENNPYSNI